MLEEFRILQTLPSPTRAVLFPPNFTFFYAMDVTHKWRGSSINGASSTSQVLGAKLPVSPTNRELRSDLFCPSK
jgi:hypothetical protein